MGYDLSRLTEYGIDTDTGLGYTGSMDKYISALQRFYKSYEKNSEKIETALAGSDIENYMITVHALKSNARMIGASDLSAKFEALEMAARKGDRSEIDSATPDTLNSYEFIIKALEPIGTGEKIQAADELSAGEARKISAELLDALDEYDDELSASLAGKLAGYPFRLTQREMLKKAQALIGDFMYDDAADIIRDISETIE